MGFEYGITALKRDEIPYRQGREVHRVLPVRSTYGRRALLIMVGTGSTGLCYCYMHAFTVCVEYKLILRINILFLQITVTSDETEIMQSLSCAPPLSCDCRNWSVNVDTVSIAANTWDLQVSDRELNEAVGATACVSES
jgi:hypothetical protein